MPPIFRVCVGLTASLMLASCATRPDVHPPAVVTVDAAESIRSGAERFLGINLNYLRDSDANRPQARPLSAALNEMDVRWLRFPGGEKSDFVRWERSTDGRIKPVTLGAYRGFAGQRMDLDTFAALAREVGAQPIMVVGYDSKSRSGLTESEWLANAVDLVRYARKSRLNIRHWEIGNENWHNGTASPAEMARVVLRFSKAMKAADPSIQIGASGRPTAWWPTFLRSAGPALDFVTISHYNVDGWPGYRHWLKNPNANHSQGIDAARTAIRSSANPESMRRLKILVVETNSLNWGRGWGPPTTVGHALVSFDTIGKLLIDPDVMAANYWTTRWVPEHDRSETRYSALDRENRLLPGGQMLAMWGQGLRSRMIPTTGNPHLIRAYASANDRSSEVSVWLLNQSLRPSSPVRVEIKSVPHISQAHIETISAPSPDAKRFDYAPSQPLPTDAAGNIGPLTLPALSITRITFIQ